MRAVSVLNPRVHSPAHLACRHKDMLFSTTDGNFQSSLKDKPFDDTDFSLTDGGGAIVEQSDFKKYKGKVKPEKDVRAYTQDLHVMANLSAGHYVQQIWSDGLFALHWASERHGGTLVCETHVCSSERHCRHHRRRGVSAIPS